MKNQRTCVACRQVKDKDELFRIQKEEDKEVCVCDGKTAGRGAYICKNSDCIKKAQKTKALNRAFKVAVDETVYTSLLTRLGD